MSKRPYSLTDLPPRYQAQAQQQLGSSQAGQVTKRNARGQPPRGTMNKTETTYATHLETLKRSGSIQDYAFEALKLRLADKTFYTPDFLVLTQDWTVELHEIKGHWEDDARVKIKVAAKQFPWFRFIAIQMKGRQFITEEF
jgi:hypothetical protein